MTRSSSLIVFLGLAALALVGGCDLQDVLPLPKFQKQTDAEEARKEQRESKEAKVQADRLAGARESMRAFVSAEISGLEDGIRHCQSKIDEIGKDRALMSSRVATLCRTNGQTRAKALSALLGDETINALAMKYLNVDFHMTKLAFDEACTSLAAKHRKRESELAESKAAFEQEKKESAATIAAVKDKARRAVTTLREDIRRLEAKAERLSREISRLPMTDAVSDTLRSKKSELDRIMEQLRPLRSRYDAYESVMRADRARSTETVREDARVRDARYAHERRTERIKREYAKLGSVSAVASEYDALTLDALTHALAGGQNRSEAFAAEARSCLAYAKGLLPTIDHLGEEALKDVRLGLEQRLNKLNGLGLARGR